MAAVLRKIPGPLPLGKQALIDAESPIAAGSKTTIFTLDSDSVLFSLFISAVTGNVSVEVFTQANEDSTHDVSIISFPTVAAPTTDLLLKKAAACMNIIKVVVTYTGSCTYEIYAKGISLGETSVKILGPTNWEVSQITIPGVPTLMVPVSLVDRAGLVFKNNGVSSILYVAEIAAKATTSIGYPIGPGESLAFDVAAGEELWAISDSTPIDVRIAQAGG